MKSKDAMMNCMKCGDCMAVCPTFAITGDESAVARGRIRLIKAFEDGEIELTDTLVDKINSCMMCMACTANCPSGVQVDKLILSARKKIAQENGLPLFKRIIISSLMHPSLITLVSKFSPLYRPFLGNIIPESFGNTFTGRGTKNIENPKMRVALFAGCVVNFVYPGIGDALLNVLSKNGIGVHLIKEKCCGAPAKYTGEENISKRLAQENIERFSGLDVDAIVTCCPTCENVIKEYPELLENDKRAIEMSEKITNISQFLKDVGVSFDVVDRRVAYHPPCHLKYGTGLEEEMNILGSTLEKEITELEGCCGFVGMFSISYPDMSKMIWNEKMDQIESCGIDTVVTGCSGCKMYIEKGLKERGLTHRVMHTIELLDEACA
jgi:glycolate oxidase iron-sulfur subunit